MALARYTGRINAVVFLNYIYSLFSNHLKEIDLRDTYIMDEENMEDYVHRLIPCCPNIEIINMTDSTEVDIIRVISCLVSMSLWRRLHNSEIVYRSSQMVDPITLLSELQKEVNRQEEDDHSTRDRLPRERIMQIYRTQVIPTVLLSPDYTQLVGAFSKNCFIVTEQILKTQK